MKDRLTKEQSQHLIELGFPKWKVQEIKPSDVNLKDWIPTITLTDLLDVLPKVISDHKYRVDFFLTITGCIIEGNDSWEVNYSDNSEAYIYNTENKELIDALYELCVWCLENKYLKF